MLSGAGEIVSDAHRYTQPFALCDEAMMPAEIERLPGFRRRVRIVAAPSAVCVELEDDFHCMGVRIRHAEGVAIALESAIARAPWATCPGAIEVLRQTFVGVSLAEFAKRGEKRANCTHLHDLALLAAAHVADTEPLCYDILVSDIQAGRRLAELRRNGTAVLSWTLLNGQLIEPTDLAGVDLESMRPWIESLDPPHREIARMLRWATMVANGRALSLDDDAARKLVDGGLCYSFQPHNRERIRRTGMVLDFGPGRPQPLQTSPLAGPENRTYPPGAQSISLS